MKRVILHGSLRDLDPRGEYEFEVNTLVEAIEAVSRFSPAFRRKLDEDRRSIQVAGFNDPTKWSQPTDVEEFHIFPAVLYGKRNGIVQVVIGATLMIAAFLIAGPGGLASANWFVQAMFLSGATMVLGGVIQMLSPQPTIDTGTGEQNPEASKYLGAPGNTVKIGTRIPKAYGRFIVGGHYLSFNIDAKNVATA